MEKKIIKVVERPPVEKTEEIVKTVDGFYCIYKLSLFYGGPEEGGWWRDAGELIAAIPASRLAVHKYVHINHTKEIHFEDGEVRIQLETDYGYQATVEYVYPEKPKYVQDVIDKIVELGYGKFDSEYRSTRPKHESLDCQWSTSIEIGFSERSCYD